MLQHMRDESMRFVYRKLAHDNDSVVHDAILLDGYSKILFALRVPDNTIEAWKTGIEKMASDPKPYYRGLIENVKNLHHCTYEDEETLLTLWKILFALLISLDENASSDLRSTITQCLKGWLYFDSKYDPNEKSYFCLVVVGGQVIIQDRYHPADQEADLPYVPLRFWMYAISKLQKRYFEYFTLLVSNYESLLESTVAYWQDNSIRKDFILCSFANFSKALIDHLEGISNLNVPITTMNAMLGVVVKNEYERLDEQQAFLQRILYSKEADRNKFERLEDIAKDVREDMQHMSQVEVRLIAIIGAISAFYLRQYDFDHALHFWSFLKRKDWLLRGILAFYHAPRKYIFGALLWMGAATVLTMLRPSFYPGTGQYALISYAVLAMLIPVLVFIPALSAFVVWRFFIARRGPEYIELFFPRLLGAIIVGLSVLLFQDTSWRFGWQLDTLNLLLICLVMYPLALLYIFINIHKELRFLPIYDASSRNKENISTMRRSLSVSSKVVSIGLFEALFAVLLTSAIFYKGAIDPTTLQSLIQRGLAITWEVDGLITVGFFPTLVLLWTGLSLLIGAFAQLLWQDQQITST